VRLFRKLEREFYSLRASEAGGFERAADAYAKRISERLEKIRGQKNPDHKSPLDSRSLQLIHFGLCHDLRVYENYPGRLWQRFWP
jgi:hypothetical protein